MHPLYELTVGSIGTVYRGYDRHTAVHEFEDFVRLSKAGYGRAAGEPVTLTLDGEVIKEHAGEPA